MTARPRARARAHPHLQAGARQGAHRAARGARCLCQAVADAFRRERTARCVRGIGAKQFIEEAAVVRGAEERVIPILMTATAAGLALVPLALGGGRTGSEIQTPMAIVILCGLTTSTLLNMVVLPTLYLRYAHPAPR